MLLIGTSARIGELEHNGMVLRQFLRCILQDEGEVK